MTSNETRALLAAARGDAPSKSKRDAMWGNLESQLGLALPVAALSGTRLVEAASPTQSVGASAAPSLGGPTLAGTGAAKVASSAVLKAGLLGGGLGSVLTAVLVLVALRPAPTLEETVPVALSHETQSGERSPSVLAPLTTAVAEGERARLLPPTPKATVVDVLSREVALVVDARQALLSGDGERGLARARKARELHGQLEREALTLEVRALRTLGRDTEADRAEMELRILHPPPR